MDQGEVFGFLGPNGAGKTTTIRTILDLIRPTSGRALRLRHRVHRSDPVAIHRAGGLHPGRVRPVRPADRRPDPALLRQPSGRRGCGLPGVAHRALRDRPVAQVQGVLEGQQAEDRPRHRAPAPAGAADPRRADVRASTRSSSSRSTPWSASPRTRAGRSSSRATSCPRSSGPAIGSRSSATAGSSRWTASRACATWPTTRWSCASPARSRPRRSRGSTGVSDVVVEDHVLRLRVSGAITPLVQEAARHELLDFVSREPSLEETFLAQYGDATRRRPPRRSGHDRRRPRPPVDLEPDLRLRQRLRQDDAGFAPVVPHRRGPAGRPAAVERRGVRRGVRHAGVARRAGRPRRQPAAGPGRRLRQPVPDRWSRRSAGRSPGRPGASLGLIASLWSDPRPLLHPRVRGPSGQPGARRRDPARDAAHRAREARRPPHRHGPRGGRRGPVHVGRRQRRSRRCPATRSRWPPRSGSPLWVGLVGARLGLGGVRARAARRARRRGRHRRRRHCSVATSSTAIRPRSPRSRASRT